MTINKLKDNFEDGIRLRNFTQHMLMYRYMKATACDQFAWERDGLADEFAKAWDVYRMRDPDAIYTCILHSATPKVSRILNQQ